MPKAATAYREINNGIHGHHIAILISVVRATLPVQQPGSLHNDFTLAISEGYRIVDHIPQNY